MRIVFLDIYSDDHNPNIPKWKYSLAIAYLKSYLTKSKYYDKLDFIHLKFYESVSSEFVENEIISSCPDVLAVSCYVWNIKKVLEVLSKCKKINPAIKVVLGGAEFMQSSKEQSINLMAENSSIDFIVLSEGEITFFELIESFLDKDAKQLSDINGLIYKKDNHIPISNPPRENMLNINDIPSPYLNGTVDLNSLRNELIAIETQRGCPYGCAYCNYTKGSTKIRLFETDRVLKELELIIQHQPRQIFLMDPTFNSIKKRSKGILEAIKIMREKYKSKTTISTEMFPENLDEELIVLCKDAGMNYLQIGIQTFNEKALKLMGRTRNEAKLRSLISFALKQGLNIAPQIIYGLPGDDIASFYNTFNNIYMLQCADCQISKLLLLPGTVYLTRAKELGIIYEKNAPYSIIESIDFTKDEILLLDNFRNLTLMTLQMKQEIMNIQLSVNVNYHEIFIEFINNSLSKIFDFSWPIISKNDSINAKIVINNFGDYLLNVYGNKIDEQTKLSIINKKRSIIQMIEYTFLQKSLPNSRVGIRIQ
ncbi:MAG: B12-binding domain-containing radical SAM protein [Nitrospirae bacterium]|nr:B12-binding domain-containing radical SAM protein [Nitrospirota bacterium]